MKKLFAIVLLVLSLSIVPVFAQDYIYNGYTDMGNKELVVINNGIYQLGDMVNDTCKIKNITKEVVTISCDDKDINVYFQKPKI